METRLDKELKSLWKEKELIEHPNPDDEFIPARELTIEEKQRPTLIKVNLE